MGVNISIWIIPIIIYLSSGIFIAWFIWTDRKYTKISALNAFMWIILCSIMPILVPVYLYYRREKI